MKQPFSTKIKKRTWIDDLLEKYSDCPNPVNYPKSASYYLMVRKMK